MQLIGILLLMFVSLPLVFATESGTHESEIVVTKGKEPSDSRFIGNVGLSVSYLQRYNPYDSRKPFKGPALTGYWADSDNLHKLELSVLDSELEVLGPGVPRKAERIWDVIYSFDDYQTLRQLTGGYLAPSIGLRLKEKLTVTCKNKRSHCFYATGNDWDIEGRSEEIRPTFGGYSGFRLYGRYLVYDMNLHAMTDFEDTYLSWSIGLGLLKPH